MEVLLNRFARTDMIRPSGLPSPPNALTHRVVSWYAWLTTEAGVGSW